MNSLWMNRGSLMAIPALNDRGFAFGFRVMTSLLWENGHFIDFDRHMDRLQRHAETVGLPQGGTHEEVRFEMEAGIQQLNATRIACRVYFTAGPGAFKDPVTQTSTWIHLEGLSTNPPEFLSLRLDSTIDPNRQRGEHVKTGLYADSLPDLLRARKKGFSDILWSNADQEIAECTAGNVFLIGREGDLVEIATPPPTSGILPGITRRRVIELLNAAKIPVTERVIYREEIPRFDEAFVTSSLSGVRPVSEIGSHKLHSDRPTAVFRHILRLWNSWKASLPGS
ncbi:MAG: aminotransferase class IV [Proteobacteria bacterium]|nr:aminotransferase class IV [Pseudomonadota bacterium]